MPRDEIVVLRDHLAEHPAWGAWAQIQSGATVPTFIEVLKPETRKSAVYRLHGVTGAAEAIIAKRQAVGDLAQEARLYSEVLPRLPVSTLECHGYLENLEGYSWLFLEDAGEVWYSPEDSTHCALVVEWMARFHTASSTPIPWLRYCGSDFFRGVLKASRLQLLIDVKHPALTAEDLDVFGAMHRHLDRIDASWDDVERACAGMPQTLVHGDFVPKNVRIRGAGTRAHAIVFDWETAGTGPPAADIALLPDLEASRRTYFELVCEAWSDLAWSDINRMDRVGQLFRLLHAIKWQSRSFSYAWVERAVRNLDVYEQALGALIRDGWLDD